MEDNHRGFIKKGTVLAALSIAALGSVKSGLLGSNDDKSLIESKTSTQKKTQKKVEWPIAAGTEMPKLTMVISPRAKTGV